MWAVLIGLLTPLFVFGAIVFVLIMGPTHQFRGTIIEAAFELLTESFPACCCRVSRKILGKRATGACVGCFSYFFETAHPLFQIAYVVLLTSAVYVFLREAWLYIPGKFIPTYHAFFVPAVIAFAYIAFALASFTDPGRITPSNVEQAQATYPCDYVVFMPKDCRTCKTAKPARSKHCSLCHACVARNDHHCVWVNNCIGQRNHRFFLMFLFSLALAGTYGAWLVWHVMLDIRLQRGLDRLMTQIPSTGEIVPLSFTKSMIFLMQTDIWLGGVGVLAAIISVVLSLFLLYSLYLVARGITANEAVKWDEVGDMIAQGRLYRIERTGDNWTENLGLQPKATLESPTTLGGVPQGTGTARSSGTSGIKKRRKKSKTKNAVVAQPNSEEDEASDTTTGQREASHAPPLAQQPVRVQVMHLDELNNIYDHGWWRNLLDVMLPPPLKC